MMTIHHIVAPEDLMAYLDGELPRERAAAVRAHLSDCDACQAAIAEFQHVASEFRAWGVGPAPDTLRAPAIPDERRKRTRLAFPVWTAGVRHTAAAALCIAAVGGLLWVYELQSDVRKSRIVQTPPEQRAAEPMSISLGGGGGGGGTGAVAGAAELPLPAAPQVASAGAASGGAPPVLPQAATAAQIEQPGSKIVRTVRLTIVTKDLAIVRPALDTMLRDLGGFVGSIQASGEANSGALRATLRIPVQRLDQAVNALRALGRVTDETQTGEDVGEQVRDLEARLANSRNTEKRLTEVLRTRTGDVSDVLQVEREIARVRGEIERMDAERAHLERRVAYATITLRVEQERQATLDVGRQPLSMQFRNALVDGLSAAFVSIVDVALALLHVAPLGLMWTLVLWWPVRFAVRRGRGWLVPSA